MTDEPPLGETWVYESLVTSVPGVRRSAPAAIAVQFVAFEAGVLLLGAWYGRWEAALAGTVAVAVAAAGSAAMLDLSRRVRELPSPPAYRRLLFGSSIEVALGVVAFAALVTHLFVYDPRTPPALVTDLLGPRPPVPAVLLMLLVLWDLCYRIGTGWWAAVAAVYRSWRFEFDPATAAAFRRLDARNAAFALVQLAVVPVVADQPLLAVAVVGHVVAVGVAVAASLWLLSRSTSPLSR